MNKQKNANSQQATSKSQSSVTSGANASNATNVTSSITGESLSAKQKASKSEYGTLTAKADANNDYK